MRVLWLTNNLLPDISRYLNIPIVNKTGWLHSAANQIKSKIELYVASTYNGEDLKSVDINDISYILVPKSKVSNKLSGIWKKVLEIASPDVIHIHGTEYPTGLSLIKACDPKKVVVSIQGLISEIAKYYTFGIENLEILKHLTLRDLLKQETLWHQKSRFVKSGHNELEYLRQAKNFIGRTNWDKAHVLANNPMANYFFNNETLRESFYQASWNINKIERHTIFFSQSTYPMKGLHVLINALPMILRHFPDTKIKVAGFDITKASRQSLGRLKTTTYGCYIYSLIKKLNIDNSVVFLGGLDEAEMCDAYLKSHVYINSSAIENSSNSIGEAQLLGVPVIASYVGGTDSMVTNNVTGLLYPCNDTVRLASLVIDLFKNDNLAMRLSEKGQLVARERHDKAKNREALIVIYREISANASGTKSDYFCW